MATDVGQQPETCPNCGSQNEFTVREVRFVYDKRSEIGNSQVTQTLSSTVTTWKCRACQSLVDVWRNVV